MHYILYMEQMKKCTKCRQDLPIGDFFKRRHRPSRTGRGKNPDGLDNWCKSCATKKVRLAGARKKLLRRLTRLIANYRIVDGDQVQYCHKCGMWQSLGLFGIPGKRTTQCRSCKSARGRAWAKKNPERHRELGLQYQQNNRLRCVQYSVKSNRKRRKADPALYMATVFGTRIRTALKRRGDVLSKRGRSWESLLGYTVADLRERLEGLFKQGMTWDNYGSAWHIDHIIPIRAFNFSSVEHLDFKRCWALDNLQPLWAFENLKKNGRFEGSFQPALALEVKLGTKKKGRRK